MLSQILKDMYVEPELLAELSIDQKQILFGKMREEQIRRWRDREQQLDPEDASKLSRKPNRKGKNAEFRTGTDGNEWVWVMGDHTNDVPIDLPFVRDDDAATRKEATEVLNGDVEVSEPETELESGQETPQRISPPIRRRSPSQELHDSLMAFRENLQREVQENQDQTPADPPDTVDAASLSSTRIRTDVRNTANPSQPDSGLSSEHNTPVSSTSNSPLNASSVGSSGRSTPRGAPKVPTPRDSPGTITPTSSTSSPSTNSRASPVSGTSRIPLPRDLPVNSRLRGDLEKGSVRSGPNVKNVAAVWSVVANNGLGAPSATAVNGNDQFPHRNITSVSEADNEPVAPPVVNGRGTRLTSSASPTKRISPSITPVIATPAAAVTTTTLKASSTPIKVVSPTPPSTVTSATPVAKQTVESDIKATLAPSVTLPTKLTPPTQTSTPKLSPSEPANSEPSASEIEEMVKALMAGQIRPVTRMPKSSKPVDRNAIVNWFQREELPKRVVMDKSTGLLGSWFHGIISRERSEELLRDAAPGTFLVRVSERIWGYAISYKEPDRCKHFLIILAELVNQTEEGIIEGYQFFGPNQKIHNSIAELVAFHKSAAITPAGNELLLWPCAQSSEQPDYAELFRNWKPSSVIDCFTEVF